MRLEIVEAFLEGRVPNWYCARYLDYDEQERRTQNQIKITTKINLIS